MTLVSIMKAIDVAVHDATVAAAAGEFDAAPYVGTLENEGVKLSGFGDFEGELPDGLLDELAELQKQIIAGGHHGGVRELPVSRNRSSTGRVVSRLPLAPCRGRTTILWMTLLDNSSG